MLLRVALGSKEPHEKSFANDIDGRWVMIQHLTEFARKHGSERIVFVYEASGQGFGLYDLLQYHGIEAYVLAPAHLPKTAKGKKNKTDARDAQMLLEQARGYVLAGNQLPIVWTPPLRLRNDRELVRGRLEAAEAVTRIKLQIFSFLKRYGIVTPEWFRKSRVWSRRFVRWLKEQAERMDQVLNPVLLALVERFELMRGQVTTLDRHLRQLAKTDRYRVPVDSLLKIPGVGRLTALTFLTEMGDLTRFSNRRQVAAYLGLCPSSFETGLADDRKGHITRQGTGRVRKVLCQATWTGIRRDTATAEAWQRIRGDKPGRAKKAVVALMRILAITMWHRALDAGVSEELTSPPPKPPSWITPPSGSLAG
jgi:Transposase and inactivated derivatives